MTQQTENQSENNRHCKIWTPQEDARLLRQVETFPHNLSRCFIIVAEEIGRTPSAVQAHWYSSLSKKTEEIAFFTASRHHVAKNRKNGMGVTTSLSIWRRLYNIIRNL